MAFIPCKKSEKLRLLQVFVGCCYLVKSLLQANWHRNSQGDIKVVGTFYSSPCFPLCFTKNNFLADVRHSTGFGRATFTASLLLFWPTELFWSTQEILWAWKGQKRQWIADTPQAISQGCSCCHCQVLTCFIASSCMQCQTVSWATRYQWQLRDQLGGSCFKMFSLWEFL